MGLYKGTIYAEHPDGDKIEFTAILRLAFNIHWPKEQRVAEAMNTFKRRYEQGVLDALRYEPVILHCECEEISFGDADPVNSYHAAPQP